MTKAIIKYGITQKRSRLVTVTSQYSKLRTFTSWTFCSSTL